MGRGEFFLSRWGVLSLTERTEFTEPFGARFERTEGLRHTENTEAFQPTLAVNSVISVACLQAFVSSKR